MKILFFFIVLFPFISAAQSRASFDLVAGTDYSYRILSANNSNGNQAIIKDRNSTEIPSIGFRGGFNMNLKLGRQFFFRSGIRYVSNGYNSTKLTGIVYESEYDPVSGNYTKNPELPHEFQYKTNVRFIELPLVWRYVFCNKKISCFGEMGLAVAYLINHKFKTITDIDTKSQVIKSNNMFDLHLNGIISVGVQKELNEQILFFAQPVFRYALSPLFILPIKEHLYTIGVEAGLRYYIGKK